MKKFSLLLLLMFILVNIYGQSTMYYMDRLPQVRQYNPAIFPRSNVFVSFPSVSMDFRNSTFNLGEFIDFYKDGGTLGNISSKLEVRSDLGSFGFKVKKNYFSVGLGVRSFVDINAPSDLVYLMKDDLSGRLPLNIDGIGLDMNTFSQLSLAYSRKFGNLSVGISPKLVGSLVGVRVNSLKLRIDGDNDYIYDYSGNVRVGLSKAVTDNANLEPNNLNFEWNNLIRTTFKDPTVLLDLGVQYRINRLVLSMSVLDIGKLDWKYGYSVIYNEGSTMLSVEPMSFSMDIPMKVYVGAGYKVFNNWNVGLLYRDVIYGSEDIKSGTLSINGDIGRILSTTVSYTYSKDFDGLGVGLRLRFLPGVDLYAVTDNIFDAFDYRSVQYSTVFVGLNFSLGIR